MNRILFTCLLLLLVAGTLTGQASDQPNMGCNLAREKAPAIRGVKLGMTADELHTLLPGMREDYKDVLVNARKFPDFGAAVLAASVVDKDIEGFNFRLFDDHVVQYSVYYRGPNSVPRGPSWPSTDALIAMIARFADAYHLPEPANWIADAGGRVLKCKGFEVRVSAPSGAIIIVNEPGNPWVAEQKKRRDAYEEQLRRDFKP